MFCHLANIAYRTGRRIDDDGAQQLVVGQDDKVTKLWSREYEDGWRPTS
jgi:hypothetical protein